MMRKKGKPHTLAGLVVGLTAGMGIAQAPVPVAPRPVVRPEATPNTAPRPIVQTSAEVPAPAPTSATTVTGKPVAVVNGEAISAAELELAIKQMGPAPVQLPEARRRQIQFETLGLLMDEALMRQFLAKNAPPVAAAEIEQKMKELAEGLSKQGKSIADLCRETHQSEATFRATLGFRLQWQNYTDARVTEAEVHRYYHEYKDFFDGTAVKASHIVLRVPADAPAADVDAARAKLQAMRDDIVAKKIEFAAAAKQFSQCKSAENGGDIGYFPRKWVVEEPFARTAFRLPPGQVSEVVRTDYGLHLILVTERKPGTATEYTKIKEEVREVYKEDLRQQILAQQRKAAKIEIHLQ